jgi:hypothetical protein
MSAPRLPCPAPFLFEENVDGKKRRYWFFASAHLLCHGTDAAGGAILVICFAVSAVSLGPISLTETPSKADKMSTDPHHPMFCAHDQSKGLHMFHALSMTGREFDAWVLDHHELK